ncbi:MAG TPA: ParB/RepB/Spo0J family partition protein [Bdellovibrionota bacterium]|nr:ParB/RepB/Spo0J family partition protein [Bdellovibrionota bacterium]
MDNQRGLGRGLSSLIPDVPLDSQKTVLPEERGGDVSVEKIFPNPLQPRKNFAHQEMRELSQSIRKYGLLQPLLVRKVADGYEIIAGERRWRAAKMAGLNKVPVIIQQLKQREVLEVSLIENIQREDLNCIEEALAYQRLVDEYGYTQTVIAERVGKDRSHVANTLRLLNLPQVVKDALVNGKISMGHARAVLSLASSEEKEKTLDEVLEGRLSVRQTETLVRQKKSTTPRELSPDVKEVENQLRHIFKTKVKIQSSKGDKGKITIEYYSKEDLIRVVDILTKNNATEV